MTAHAQAEEAAVTAADELLKAASARKCWSCGCLHSSLKSIDRAHGANGGPMALRNAISEARGKLVEVRYECLGCEICFPANALNALEIEADACASTLVEYRNGWPPFPGQFRVMAFMAPVAVCTLTDDDLMARLVGANSPHLSIIGALQTENLGIERLIENVASNPHLRFLILCGADSQQIIGHLPGRSLLALAKNGIDERGRIVDAPGRRPMLKNIAQDVVEHFRRAVEVRDLIGETNVETILAEANSLAARNPGPVTPPTGLRVLSARPGILPERMTSDPAGYFVIHVDRLNHHILLEHYQNDGLLDDVIMARNSAEIYCAAIESRRVSRLDHAAYLGRELARAEDALKRDEAYVQDGAPEAASAPASGCGCPQTCSTGIR